MKKDVKKWLKDMLSDKEKKAMPILSFPCISLMNIDVKELISSADLQAEGMRLITEREPTAASVSLMDLSLEAECFGSEIRVSKDEVPTVVGSVVSSEAEAEALQVPEIGAGRTSIYIEAIQKASQMITDRPVFAGVIGPFSLSGRLMDVTRTMLFCYDEPDMVHMVLAKATEFLIKYINAYKEVGADGVLIAEPLAGLLSPSLAKEFSADYVKTIVSAVADDDFIVLYHNCGNGTPQQIDSIVDTGASVLHFGNSVSMTDILEKVPENILVMGNIDPAGEFRNGTPESINKAVKELMKKCSKYNNFVISSGCDIPPMSPWENIDAFFKAVDEFYKEMR